jgi:hypothetical protein
MWRRALFAPGYSLYSFRARARAAHNVFCFGSLATDGGKVWKERLDKNSMSFEDVHAANSAVDIFEAQVRG